MGGQRVITFEDRAVAFIDVLGFKALTTMAVTDSAALLELNRVVALLGAVIPILDSGVEKTVPSDLIPKHIYISDSIILSAPLRVPFDHMRNYSGLDILVMRAIQVSHALLNAGYLVRGGIAVGSVWHNISNVVGPAYQEAYLLEQKSWEPRIILSEEAMRLWQSGGPSTGSRMCIHYDGAFMVNGLHDYYVPAQFERNIQKAFRHYEAIASANLNAGLGGRELQKWAWMRKYIAAEQAIAFP
jgi:hypothetical protein